MHEGCCSTKEHDHEHHHHDQQHKHKEGATKYIFMVEDLDCGNCANKIEVALNKEDYIENATLNFMLKKLTVESTEQDE